MQGIHLDTSWRGISRALLSGLIVSFWLVASASAASDEDLAKQLSNPVANLISVPLQGNLDYGIGSEDASRFTLNIQPVIPVTLNQDWNLITRTIVPVIHAEAPAPGVDDHTGLGDIVQSFFFSPKEPSSTGWISGVGPVFLYPTGANGLTGDKWGAGPTAVFLKQENGWTYGALANHLWSVGGSGDRDVNATFIQPFGSFTTKTQTTYTLNTESTYDWEGSDWTIPINVSVSQLTKVGGSPVQFVGGARYYLDKPTGGPDWGLRFGVTFLFPQ